MVPDSLSRHAVLGGVGTAVAGSVASSLLVVLGIGYSLSAYLPVVGPAVSTAVFGTLHAVVLGLFVERTSARLTDADPSSAPSTNPANS